MRQNGPAQCGTGCTTWASRAATCVYRISGRSSILGTLGL
jgi:hypothetical protein